MTRNLRRWWRPFRDTAHHIGTLFMNTMDSQPDHHETVEGLMYI